MVDADTTATFGPPPPYDPECAAVIAALPPFPPLTADGITQMRAASASFMPRPTDEQLAADGTYDVETRSIPGPPGAPQLSVITCLPTGTTGPTPTLLYVHGGGMIIGTARDALQDMMGLAAGIGAGLVSVEYRLAPETPHPGPVEDCYAALVWLAENAAALNVDPARIVLIGPSAGGGLAAAVTMLARDRRGPAIRGTLLMSPMLDDRNDSGSVHQMAALPMWNRAANEVGWTALLGSARGGPQVSPYAAPARATDLAGLPPTYIDVGSVDSFRDEDVAYAGRIWAAGGVAELHVWPGGFHGFEGIVPHSALARAAVAARLDWLRRLNSSDAARS